MDKPQALKANRKPYKISDKAKLILIRSAKKYEELASELRDGLKLQIRVGRVQQILHDCHDLKSVKINRSPFYESLSHGEEAPVSGLVVLFQKANNFGHP